MYALLANQADFVLFTTGCVLVWGLASWLFRRSPQHRMAILLGWQFLAVVLVPGWYLVEASGDRESTRLKNLIAGYAPIYAQELERLGHAQIPLDTTPDHPLYPLYLELIEAQKKWLATNPAIADVYTFRRLADGQVVLVVDSETDYDGDGQYSDEREQRTQIGEVYKQVSPQMLRTFEQGTVEVDGPIKDRWGTWISANVPMRNAYGKIEAVLGVDYPASEWQHAVAMARLSTMAMLGVILSILHASLSIISMQHASVARYRQVTTALQRSLSEVAEARARLESQAAQLQGQNQQLQIARHEAEAAARAKSEFLANMSHEIRTPMTAILGFAETLLEDKASPEQVAAVQTIQRNGAHLLEIINDVLDLSKIEANKLNIEVVPCRLPQVIEEVRALMSVRTEAKGLALAVDCEADFSALVLSDPTRLRQILLNLVGNAIKFTSKGTVRISLKRLTEAHDLATIELAVSDTGIGMTTDQVERLFMPFSQADNSMSRRFGGTGLGLMISQRLANMLGGAITVQTKAGEGSTFRLIFTAGLPASMPLPAMPTKREAPLAIGNPLLTGMRILLAEDGPDNQRLIAHILQKAGAEVIIADNGQAAVAAVDTATEAGLPFDVILMDMQMPLMDGYAATQLLRCRGYSGVIIALTAHAMEGDRERCLNAGCTCYATKPIQRQQLMQLVHASLAPESH